MEVTHHPVEGTLIYSMLWLPNEEFPASWGVLFFQVYGELGAHDSVPTLDLF